MAKTNTETYVRHKFSPNTKGYVFRDSTEGYRPAVYSQFLNYVDDLKDANGFTVSFVVAGRKGPTYRQKGKMYDCYDTFIIAYIRRHRYVFDRVVFYTVRKYVDRKLSIVRPNSRNSIYYKDMVKQYKLYKHM